MQQVELPSQVKPLLQHIGQVAQKLGVNAYAVGGCVRDWCLGMTTTADLDVTVEGDGLSVARAAADVLGGTLLIHEQFGTATIRLPDGRIRRLDVASCRTETYAKPGAYPRVSPGTLNQDLVRRDFTINAMAVALNPGRFGDLVDPFGGRRDLSHRTLRVLHPRSFLDDPSRILRGIRFAQRFRAHFDAATARLLREALCAGALGWLNAGRLRKEFERMLQEPDPAACVQTLNRAWNS